jgi:hypothetical protein
VLRHVCLGVEQRTRSKAHVIGSSSMRSNGPRRESYLIADKIPMSQIGIAVRKGNRAPVVDNFRSFALEKLRRARSALFATRR